MEEEYQIPFSYSPQDLRNPETWMPDSQEETKFYKSTGSSRKVNFPPANKIAPIYEGYEITPELITKIAKDVGVGKGYYMTKKGVKNPYSGKKKGEPLDCSGWTRIFYQHFGVDIGEGTSFQQKGGWQKVNIQNRKEWKPGDLFFFAPINGVGHTGIFYGFDEKGNPLMFDSSTKGTPGVGLRSVPLDRPITGMYRPYVSGKKRKSGGRLIPISKFIKLIN